MARRYGRPFTVALAALLAHGAGNAIAAGGAMLIAPILTPNAKQVLLALALIFAAAGALWRLKAPDRLEGWRLGSFLTAFLGVFTLALGDTTQFFTLAFAVRAPSPWFAFGGACAAILVVNLGAALAGELAWRRLPVRGFRIGFGLFALFAGLIIGAAALRLI